MGVSVSGTLLYGFVVAEPEDEPRWPTVTDDDGEEKMVELSVVLAKMGGVEPPDEKLDEARYERDGEYKQAWRDHWARQRELEAASPVEVVDFNHCNYRGVALTVKASRKNASPYEPVELGQSVEVQAEWREQLRSFCERAGIEFREPQLLLCSYWDG